MKENSKPFNSSEEFQKALSAMHSYQQRHISIREDYELLLEITTSYEKDYAKFNSLYRASLKGFLSLIESDIYGLNQIDPYEGYTDKHSFEHKFKRTFKKICNTWNKEEIILKYLDSKYANLKNLKKKRDKLIHPKETSDLINVNLNQLETLKLGFQDYTNLIDSIMNGFFISPKNFNFFT
ncbi:hypothetical protein [Gaetbulibacter sp. PBL-D1]|uniref:hypothetical protein n=1 Tax=Gaetbulibacter sp. PBL-D1 TaxID=3422594 RepID=UPI003D2EE83C